MRHNEHLVDVGKPTLKSDGKPPHSKTTTFMIDRPQFLMCRPDYFAVRYVINPWMAGNLGKVSARRALSQWETLWQRLSELAEVALAPPQAGLPDMTFTANAGLVWGKDGDSQPLLSCRAAWRRSAF